MGKLSPRALKKQRMWKITGYRDGFMQQIFNKYYPIEIALFALKLSFTSEKNPRECGDQYLEKEIISVFAF